MRKRKKPTKRKHKMQFSGCYLISTKRNCEEWVKILSFECVVTMNFADEYEDDCNRMMRNSNREIYSYMNKQSRDAKMKHLKSITL